MNHTEYSLYFVNICFTNGHGKAMQIVAIDEDAAKADIMEIYDSTGISEIQIGRLRAA
jgi:predicted dinucleotide-binding enzyme